MKKINKFFKKIFLIFNPLTISQLFNNSKKFPKDFFGKKPWASKGEYLKLYVNAKKNESHMIKKFELNTGYSINKKWINKLALHTQIVKKESKLNYEHGRLVYSCLRNYLKDFENKKESVMILETGTARGFSSLCMSKALEDSCINGKIVTLDCLPHNEKMFWNCIDDLEGKKTRAELLQPWKKLLNNIIFLQCWTKDALPNLGFQRINFAFLDAQHSYKSVMSEFFYVSKYQKIGDVIVFDDVTEKKFPGIVKAVNQISSDGNYEIKNYIENEDRGYAIAKKII